MSIFMQYPGIRSEAADKGHKDGLDIEELQWGVSRRITSDPAPKSDRESANAEITDLLLSRCMDRATPQLFMESCCGRGVEVVIHLGKTGAGNGSDVYMAYTLKNALIRSYRVKARKQAAIRPRELITISFQEVELKYTPFDDNGNAEPPRAVAFDTRRNEKR